MQEKISGVKQAAFSETELLKAMAIVNVFETGKPFGDFAACVVLNDGAGVSYGINQFTHRSGSLAAVVEKYLENGGTVGAFILERALANLRRSEPAIIRSLARDEQLKKALRTAAITREMRMAQMEIVFERYLKPALDESARLGFALPLSLAVIYDGKIHGSYDRFRESVKVTPKNEKAWITDYMRQRDRWLRSVPRLRTTSYRTQFFLNQIIVGRWGLELPLTVHGFRLEDQHIQKLATYLDTSAIPENPPVSPGGSDSTAVGPNANTHLQNPNIHSTESTPADPTPTPQSQPPSVSGPQLSKGSCSLSELDGIEAHINCAAAKFDHVDRIVTGIVVRTDRAKSLWTTVAGTLWQSAWAFFGFVAGIPREVWLVVAVIAALLMLLYLYRQIELGRIRERGTHAARVQ
jgi:hypothetical protein